MVRMVRMVPPYLLPENKSPEGGYEQTTRPCPSTCPTPSFTFLAPTWGSYRLIQ
jgi:hypothetical protein